MKRTKPQMKNDYFRYFALALSAFWISGFTQIAAEKPILPITKANPSLTFVWDGTVPTSIIDREDYKGGFFEDSTDQEIFEDILTESMAIWNVVEGSYLQFKWRHYTTAPEISENIDGTQEETSSTAPSLDREDGIFALTVSSEENQTTAAFAVPNNTVDEENPEGKIITDCDIQISDGELRAASLLTTLTHELGHCLGLGHNHSNYGSIMGYSRFSESAILGLDDLSGLIYLYPSNGDESGASREFIGVGCGVISGTENGTGQIWFLLMFLSLPVLLSFTNFFRISVAKKNKVIAR